MSLQILLPFAPFLALLYIVFALVQALRHKQQGMVAALLALVALSVTLVAVVLTRSTPVLQTLLLGWLAIIAVVLFVASLLIGLIERRNKARAPGRSYSMLGIGLSIVFALAMFAVPLLPSQTAATETADAAAQTVSGDTTLQNVAALRTTNTDDPAAQANPVAEDESGEPTAVALAMTEQTGLTVEEITTQTEAGSTIADLVAANDGDLDAVVEVTAAALDEIIAAGGMQAQMMSRMGSDTSAIALQLVQGELGQAQQLLLPLLLTGEAPQFGGGGAGGGNFAPPTDGSGAPVAPPELAADEAAAGDAEATPAFGDFAPPSDSSGAPVEQEVQTNQSTPEAPAATATSVATLAPLEATEPVIRPTRIVFPTATPTPVAAEASNETTTEDEAEAVSETVLSDVTCVLVVNYNLNVRDVPTAEGSTVLVSIPFGTTVTSDGVTEDNWYSVTYDGNSGWVTGEYVTPASACADLPVLDS